MFDEEQLSCSKKSNSRVRRRAIPVFEDAQFLCSKKSSSHVRRRAILVFDEEHSSCSKKRSIRRVGRRAIHPSKKFQTAEKSRGELRFGRKFVRNDRSDENYHLKTFSEPPGFKKHVFEKFFARVSKSFQRCPFPLPFIQCIKMHAAICIA